MEDPRAINRFLLGLLCAFTLGALGCSLYWRNLYIMAGWVVGLVLFALCCRFFALLSALVFGPICWLLAKLTGRRGSQNAGSVRER